MKYVLAYDLGTGGTKGTLYNESGQAIASSFISCKTYFPKKDYREQRPEDWWISIKESTRKLLSEVVINSQDIVALGVSGHSLGVVPIDSEGTLLCEYVPIWSDARASAEANKFFEEINEEYWYMTTGNGFPAPLYSIFKIMWYKKNTPEIYEKTAAFIGTKDYVNYKLTNVVGTDYSYASGSGVYNLKEWSYEDDFIRASGIGSEKLPKIYRSDEIIGTLTEWAAKELGLAKSTKVVSGGVDNACMALGAGCIDNGMAYTNLGTSAWIAVSDDKPIVEPTKRPYVFTHCIKDMYVSATAIFSAGNSYRWVRDNLCRDMVKEEVLGGVDAYVAMNRLAQEVPLGSNKIMFNPSLAGGSSLDKSTNVRGAFIGLSLGNTREDMIRATLEGICMNLRIAMDVLENQVPLVEEMLIVGGGANSPFWMKLFADIYNKTIITTNVGQEAGSLGAAALALVGAGLWEDYTAVKRIHHIKNTIKPDAENVKNYNQLLTVFKAVAVYQSEIGDLMSEL
ncbi:MAG: FGGY family carbohydrate kinase [Eubacteriales bacterium]